MRCCFALLLFCALPTTVFAAELVLSTGPETGTYEPIARDIKRLAKAQGIALDTMISDGSVANVKALQLKKADLGIVQSDVLGFMKRSKSPATAQAVKGLRLVASLYKEEVHVLARKDIKDFKDLKSKRVVVGEEGSGNMLTAVNLLALYNIRVKDTLKLKPPEGVVAVLEGKADAVVFVGGKPVKLFQNLDALDRPENVKFAKLKDQVHFLAVDSAAARKEYESAMLNPMDYGFMDAPVKTVAVRSMLVSRPQASGSKACLAIGRLVKELKRALPDLKSTGHPKWQDVDFKADTLAWKQDDCVLK